MTAWIDDSSGVIGHLYGMETTPHMLSWARAAPWFMTARLTASPIRFTTRTRRSNYVREAVDELLAGKPVVVSQTKPYGCSVKYAD